MLPSLSGETGGVKDLGDEKLGVDEEPCNEKIASVEELCDEKAAALDELGNGLWIVLE